MNHDKYIISEFYEFSADKNLIKEAEEKNMPITMTGILQKSNTKNRNGRVYPAQILKREADKYMELVNERRAMGELDHPDSAVVSLSNVSHIVTKMWWEGDTLKGTVEVVNSPSGNILKGLLKSGVKLGISSRGVGSVKSQSDSDVVQEDFELIAFDFVSSPSTPGAYMFKEGRMWGMKKLIDDNTTTIKPEDTATIHNIDRFKKILDISKEDFWTK